MTYIGQSVKRFEDHRLLIGQGSFVDDLTLPGLLHASILRSPHAHATILTIDTTAATRLPGVVSVITANDLKGVATHLPTRTTAETDELRPAQHPVLAMGKVCYVGQPVAVVVAEDLYLAEDALERIVVDYEMLPAVIEPLEATKDDAPLLHEDIGSNVSLRTLSAGGDLEAAFAEADHVVTQSYQVQRLAPAPMEPRGVAQYQRQRDLLTVWDSTQHPHEVRDHLVHLLDRSGSSIRVVAPDVG